MARLGDFVKIRHGWPFRSAEAKPAKPGEPRLIRIGNFAKSRGDTFRANDTEGYSGEYPSEFDLEPKELLLAMTCQTSGGEILGWPMRVPDDGLVYLHNQRIGRVEVTDRASVSIDFLEYLFRSEEFNCYLFVTNEQLAAACASLRLALTERALAEAVDFQPLSELAAFINGKNFTKDAVGTGRPVIRTPEVRVGPTASTIRSEVAPGEDFVATRGDILFVWSGSLLLGRWLFEPGLVNQHIFKVKPNEGVPDWLVYGLIEHQMPWFLGLAADKATTMGHIQRRHLDEHVPVPSTETINRLDEVIQPLWASEIELAEEAQQLRRTRDELLPLLMSGKVRVLPDAGDEQGDYRGAA